MTYEYPRIVTIHKLLVTILIHINIEEFSFLLYLFIYVNSKITYNYFFTMLCHLSILQ